MHTYYFYPPIHPRSQPLDLGCFSSLKTAYRRQLANWAADTDCSRVGEAQFLDFYAEARKSAFTPENIKAGWRATGLYPINRQKKKHCNHVGL